ncbi:MAG: hypothetical protein OEZ30_10090, partial [Candidatus Aminicenantes bacterium]|nr:hypothetical protein [Candidatus Aminicenantes bacterium]
YQGRLTDDVGTPIITPTTLRFSLYQGGDAASPLSGTLVYQEDASVTPDDNGVFSHLIGSGTVIYGSMDATVFQTADPVYLEITIDPAGANETLLPRKQIVTVGYSFKSELADDADTVDGQDASSFSPVVHNHDPDYVNEGQADSVNSSMIVNGTIVDADINAGANIAGSKLNPTGLNADLLDGVHSTGFVSTAGDDMTGSLRVTSTGATYAIYGKEESTTGTRYGVYGESVSTVLAVGVMGTSPHYGVWGEVPNTGVSNYGVYGRTYSTGGAGVMGVAENASGNANGVSGSSANGNGVYGNGVYGVYGYSNSTSGRGVYGAATALSGTIYGVYGMSQSPDGYGVYGRNDFGGYGVYGNAWAMTGETYGVYGTTRSTSGYGVYGYAQATSGTTYGVYGQSDSHLGYGVYGQAPAYGVYGIATAAGGETNGVYGKTDSTGGQGVYGEAPLYGVHGHATAVSGTNSGLYGRTDSSDGYGVYGLSSNIGVYGRALTYGIEGECIGVSGRGVYGYASASAGITYGVYGISDSTSGRGVYGTAPTYGVLGIATATSSTNYGIYGTTNSASGYAGYFQGNAHVTGDFTVDGSKNCVQPIDNGKKVLLYAMESPEIWFEDFGTAQLVNGQAVVPVEKIFAQTANIEMGYLLFLTPIGECQGLYISRKDKDSFEVRELGGGTSNISFDYRIVAKRRGYEEVRFEEFTEPEQSPAEPNLPIATKAAKLQQPQRQKP